MSLFTIFDLGTGKLLGKLAYAAGPSYPPDASLKEQRLVALR